MFPVSPYNEIDALVALSPAAYTATTNGSSLDLLGYHQGATFVVVTGTITDGTHTISLEHSDDGTNWSAVSSSDIEGTAPQIGSTDDNKTFKFRYNGGKRYVRAKTTVSGATNGGIYGITALVARRKQ